MRPRDRADELAGLDALYLHWLPLQSHDFRFPFIASWTSPCPPIFQTSVTMSKLSAKSSASEASDTERIYEPLPISRPTEKLAGPPPKGLELTPEQEKVYNEVLNHFTADGYQLPCEKDSALKEQEKFWLVSVATARYPGTIESSVTLHRLTGFLTSTNPC